MNAARPVCGQERGAYHGPTVTGRCLKRVTAACESTAGWAISPFDHAPRRHCLPGRRLCVQRYHERMLLRPVCYHY